MATAETKKKPENVCFRFLGPARESPPFTAFDLIEGCKQLAVRMDIFQALILMYIEAASVEIFHAST